MQTIVFNDFASGYFELYRGGAAVFGDEIIGKDKYNRLIKKDWCKDVKVSPFYLTPEAPNDDYNPVENQKLMFDFLGIDYDYVVENRKKNIELKIAVSKNFKCVFTKNGDIVIYDGDVTPDPVRKSKTVKTLCKWYKEWGKRYAFYQNKEANPDGFQVDGWVFKPGSKYVICSSFHFIQDLKYSLIPEYFKGELEEMYNKYRGYYQDYWIKINEYLYNLDPIDLNDSWDYTDEEKEQIRLEVEEKERKEREAAEELERRKHTPGYCRLCGAENAEYIPFEEMYLCRNCFYGMRE